MFQELPRDPLKEGIYQVIQFVTLDVTDNLRKGHRNSPSQKGHKLAELPGRCVQIDILQGTIGCTPNSVPMVLNCFF